ncbi:MAG TPA: peptidoglycan-associated lipoprotein Pal [Nitrospirota bacterium]|nr:peptidoglycan-associated lipoprotein Pal [Nitrospirota bacterium]
MKIRSMMILMSVMVCSILVLTGCPKKPEETAMPEPQKPAVEAPAPAPEPAPAVVKPEPAERSAAAAAGLQPIYFDFDRSFIRDDAKAVMKENANWLKANPKVKVRIEGNCDERGTIEYNQALGQRRASAAKKYLTDLGVSAGRISLISYGKEKPVCSNTTEECWQQNRRDDLVAVE